MFSSLASLVSPTLRQPARWRGAAKAGAARLPGRRTLTFGAFVFTTFLLMGNQARALTLATDTELATAGYFVLSWDSDAELLLQESGSDTFDAVREWQLRGETARTVSGLSSGRYYYRIGSTDGAWSNTVVVDVRHHSLVRAWLFFAVGLLLFLVLAAVILFSSRAERPDGSHGA